MHKPVTLIFCNDGNAGAVVAAQMRSEGASSVFLRDANSFVGQGDDPAEKVIIMPDVPARKSQMIRETYHMPEPLIVGKNSYVSLAEFEAFMANPDESFTITPNKRGPGRPRKVAV